MTDQTAPRDSAHQELVGEMRAYTRRRLAQVGLRLARSLRAALRHGDSDGAAQRPVLPTRRATRCCRRWLSPSASRASCRRPCSHRRRRTPCCASPAAGAHAPVGWAARGSAAARLPGGSARRFRDALPSVAPGRAAAAHRHAGLALARIRERHHVGAVPFAVRDAIEDLLHYSPFASMGLVRLVGSGPWHGRSLQAGPGVWEALMARPPQLDNGELVGGYAQVPGLDDWLALPAVTQAIVALRRALPCQIMLVGGDAAMRVTRVRALLGAATVVAVRTRIDGTEADTRGSQCVDGYTAAFMHQACLWLEARDDEAASDSASERLSARLAAALPSLPELPLITSGHSERQAPLLGLPLIRLPVQALAPVARRRLWQWLLPQLGEQANVLAARYPIDPDDARDVVRDLALRQSLSPQPLVLDAGWRMHPRPHHLEQPPGHPARAAARRLVGAALPESARRQLQRAVRRVLQQITVLDDWGFRAGPWRATRRAHALLRHTGDRQDAGGRSRCAGAGRRHAGRRSRQPGVEVDRRDREESRRGLRHRRAFAGLAALRRSRRPVRQAHGDAGRARPLRQSGNRLSPAAAGALRGGRGADDQPALESRQRLCPPLRIHRRVSRARCGDARSALAPASAGRRTARRRCQPAELAAWYALSGAQIKNAALAAAFLAAAAAGRIHQRHFLLAVENEFDKAGRAHPGFPPHTVWPAEDDADDLAPITPQAR
jgi:hypothetical protein